MVVFQNFSILKVLAGGAVRAKTSFEHGWWAGSILPTDVYPTTATFSERLLKQLLTNPGP